jgi:hypothetical protein
MQSKFTLGLAAVVLGFGIASASAQTIDPNQHAKSDVAPTGLLPAQGILGSGFSAIKAHQGGDLKEGSSVGQPTARSAIAGGLVRPEGHWREGLTALNAVFLSEAALSRSIAAQQAMMAPQGTQLNPKGLLAIRAAVDLQDNQGLESLRSDAVASAPGNVLSPPSK